jgi:hypothetical protein
MDNAAGIEDSELRRILAIKRWIDPPFSFTAAWYVLAEPSTERRVALAVLTIVGIAVRLRLYRRGIFGAALRRPRNARRIYAWAMTIWIGFLTGMFLVTNGQLAHVPAAIMLGIWVTVLRHVLSRRATAWTLLFVRDRALWGFPLGYLTVKAPSEQRSADTARLQ